MPSNRVETELETETAVSPATWWIILTGTYRWPDCKETNRPWGAVTLEGFPTVKALGSFSFFGFESSSEGFS